MLGKEDFWLNFSKTRSRNFITKIINIWKKKIFVKENVWLKNSILGKEDLFGKKIIQKKFLGKKF